MDVSNARGFTFTISAILIAITLISMAFFAFQWRSSQQLSYTRILPSDSIRLQDMVSAEFRALSGISAEVKRANSSSAAVKMSFFLPLKKEGADIIGMQQFSSSLAQSLRGSGIEAALYSPSLEKAALFPDGGRLSLSSREGEDAAIYTHPAGWVPSAINITLYCTKNVRPLGPIYVEAAGSIPYQIIVKEYGGKTYLQSASIHTSGKAELNVSFYDGSEAKITTLLLPFSNTTALTYTKSPDAYLILPFDENASLAEGGVRDYSGNQNNFTLGGGNPSHAPSWSVLCKAGGCYVFDGSDDFLNASLPNLTQSGVISSSYNFGFEGGIYDSGG
jgi:hypothetical protein